MVRCFTTQEWNWIGGRVVSVGMTTKTSKPREVEPDGPPASTVRTLVGRITGSELIVAALIAAVMVVLVIIEPDIVEAPFASGRALLFTVGGTVVAVLAFVAMVWLRVPPVIRGIVLVVPFAIVNWWLLSPYFIDDVVDEGFATSISEQVGTSDDSPAAAPSEEAPLGDTPATSSDQPVADEPTQEQPPATAEPTEPAEPTELAEPTEPAEPTDQEPEPRPASGPVLLGSGQFVGLAGYSGTGDAGIFENPDGSLVLRFENFDIDNGPDLEVYLVPGADRVSVEEGSIHLGALKGNIGDQNYELPEGTELTHGAYTALVWCEAFSVEFVGATIAV